jgi:hypothetical protein
MCIGWQMPMRHSLKAGSSQLHHGSTGATHDGLNANRVTGGVASYGLDFAIVNIEYQRPGSDAIGRQSQTWARMPEGWRIVAVHVGLLAAS